MKYILGISLLLIFISCDLINKYPEDVNLALEKAGENKPELVEVLEHYKRGKDNLKYRAACFLIGNMPGHGYVTYILADSAGREVDFNVLDYSDYDHMVAAWDKIEARRGELDFKKKQFVEDVTVLTAKFLTDNIDLAFKVWREKPWAKHLTFEQFCEYVLPYRGSNEPPELSRKYFMNKYKNLENEISDNKDPVEAAKYINADITDWFVFDSRFYRHPTDQGLSQMLQSGMGRCEDMTNLAMYAMRACGIAVTSDYTPHWADTGNNHAWNALIDSSGKAVPFMGASSANPGEYKITNRVAKVYRKTYSKRKDNLIFKVGDKNRIPRWLSGAYYEDVTSDYTKVSDIEVKLTASVPDSVEYAYLAVFNDGEWKAIAWGTIKENKVLFTDIGRNIVMLPTLYLHGELMPAGEPFILSDSGKVLYLKAADKNVKMRVVSTTRRITKEATDSVTRNYLETGIKYELFYWGGEWQSCGKKVADKNGILFTGVPENALYWLVKENSRHHERIFTYENGRQVWW